MTSRHISFLSYLIALGLTLSTRHLSSTILFFSLLHQFCAALTYPFVTLQQRTKNPFGTFNTKKKLDSLPLVSTDNCTSTTSSFVLCALVLPSSPSSPIALCLSGLVSFVVSYPSHSCLVVFSFLLRSNSPLPRPHSPLFLTFVGSS
ncbi:MAG: hypothetical protein BYD32DRAFT_279142 [Podila humilis]|nr:MAG: hypothetical protein BYD32DRAFT_279142 [Podila humilis]